MRHGQAQGLNSLALAKTRCQRTMGKHLHQAMSPVITRFGLQVRHGAALGLAELVLALRLHGQALSPGRQAAVAAVVPAVEKARLYRGKGGELMRAAVCRWAALPCVHGGQSSLCKGIQCIHRVQGSWCRGIQCINRVQGSWCRGIQSTHRVQGSS